VKIAPLLCLAALAGCSFDPKLTRPDPAVPAQWPSGDAYAEPREALPTLTYADIFRDPKLQAVIAQALANNRDLAAALANVAAARAQARVERARLFPAIAVSGDATTSDTGNNGRGGRTDYAAEGGFSGFEIDLFGRQRSLGRAAFQEYLASDAASRTIRLGLVAEVANTGLQLATDRTLLAIAIDTEASARRSTDLTRARLGGGIAPRSDLRQAEMVLAQARADRADLATAVAQDRNALELLVGAPVADTLLPASIENVDGSLAELPAGLNSQVLLRRPDVAEAEHLLRAANARIGAARAAFFPQISLTALAGFASDALSSLFSNGAFGWTVSPQASLTLFDGGVKSGNLAYAKAQRDVAIAQYQRAIQNAFRDVADALARRGTIQAQFDAQTDLEAAAADNARLADARYREGIDPYLQSLEAQRSHYAARRALALTRLVRAANLVALYRSLGGDMLVQSSDQTRR